MSVPLTGSGGRLGGGRWVALLRVEPRVLVHGPLTAPARKDLFVMADREWLLKLAKALHTTLDAETLVRLFARHAEEVVPHDGIRYHHPEAGIEVREGHPESHSCSYDLVLDDRGLGNVTFTRARPFSPEETSTLEDLLANLVHPLRNALLYREALDAAARDPLTGVSNRTGLAPTLEREVELARRHGTDLAVVMFDADRFKEINDRHGHGAGDAVIKALASCITQQIRDSDLVFRYGGEEFVVVLSNTDLEGARRLAERVREAVASLELRAGGAAIPLTVSAGVATLEPGEDAASLLHRADLAMYRAKKAGRNQVACDPGTEIASEAG